MHLKLLVILCYALEFAWHSGPVIEFETNDFSLAMLQVDLNQLKSVNNSHC